MGLKEWEEGLWDDAQVLNWVRDEPKYLTLRLRTGDTDTGGEGEPSLGCDGLHF